MKMLATPLVLALLMFPGAFQSVAQDNPPGTTAPAPVLITPQGQYVYLSRFYPSPQGKQTRHATPSTVVLYFTSIDCAPCRKLLPRFLKSVRAAAAQAEAAGASFRFFLVNTDPLSTKEKVLDYMRHHEISLDTEVLLDPYRKAAGRFGVSGIPRIFVISPQGTITADITGATDDFEKRLQAGISAALADKGVQ